MIIDDNGTLREMTAEEIESLTETQDIMKEDSNPTYEDRIKALESAMIDIILGGDTDV